MFVGRGMHSPHLPPPPGLVLRQAQDEALVTGANAAARTRSSPAILTLSLSKGEDRASSPAGARLAAYRVGTGVSPE